jgi:hypothetical protein
MPLVPRAMLVINCYAKTWYVHLLTPVFVAVFVYAIKTTTSVGHLVFTTFSYNFLIHFVTRRTFKQPEPFKWVGVDLKLAVMNLAIIQCLSVYLITPSLMSVGSRGSGLQAFGSYLGLCSCIAVASVGLWRWLTFRPQLVAEIKMRRLLLQQELRLLEQWTRQNYS